MKYEKIRKVYIVATSPIVFCRYFNRAVRIAKNKSYYPEMVRKSVVKRIIENLLYLARYHETNEFYNLYGFDIKDFRNQSEYIDDYTFRLTRNDANKIRYAESQTCILRNKLFFYEFMKFKGFPVPEVFAIIENGRILDLRHKPVENTIFIEKNDYFVKELGGYVHHLLNICTITMNCWRFCLNFPGNILFKSL